MIPISSLDSLPRGRVWVPEQVIFFIVVDSSTLFWVLIKFLNKKIEQLGPWTSETLEIWKIPATNSEI